LKFLPTPIGGAFIVELEPLGDERGFFARSFCQEEFQKQGIDPRITQCNISFNQHRGTLRGLHYQVKPHEEAKLVRCTQGAIWDVIVDLRENSPTRYRWFAAELTSENRRALYIPRGLAHGFQTLSDNSEVFYQMSEFYHPESSRGVRWDDPMIGITWPVDNPVLSPRDKSYPLLERVAP
jgi:dTDP-4-dehydrorhamnose 3,5-epimerase